MTNDGSSAVLSLIDGTVFNMGASARMVLSEMIYDSNSTSNSAVVSLVKGTFSFVAGHVAHTGDMKLDTPVATMGIRGTAGTTTVNADASGNVYEVNFSLMPDPDGHVGLIQVLDRVTGLVIGTISTTANVLNVQPTANGQMIAQESPKAAAQVQAELAAAQVLYPAYQAVAATVAGAADATGADRPARRPQQNNSPPGGSFNQPQQTGPAVNFSANVNADTSAVTATKVTVDPTPSAPTTPTADPAQSHDHHAHAPSPAPVFAARNHRDHPAASARAGSGSARNTRFGRDPDSHRPDRHRCLNKRGMGRPRGRAVNLLPEGFSYRDGLSRHQKFYADVFAQRRQSERGGAAAQSNAAGSVAVPVQGGASTTVTFTIDGVVHPTGVNTTASVNENVATNPTQVILHPQATIRSAPI